MSSRNVLLILTAAAIAVALWVRADRNAVYAEQSHVAQHVSAQAVASSSTHTAKSTSRPAPLPLPAFIELGSDRCKSCRAMIPVLDRLRKDAKGRLRVQFFDVWDDEAAGKRFHIRSIPTQVFQGRDGKELFRHTGYFPFASVVAKWTALGFDILGKGGPTKTRVAPKR